MLSQVAVEALYSATYVENYIDYVENIPDAVQRHLSRIRDIDVQYRKYLKDVEHIYEQWVNLLPSTNENDIQKRNKLMAKIQKTYINAQELGDEKMQTVSHLQELIDHKSRQVDLDFKNLNYGKEDQTSEINVTGSCNSIVSSGSIAGGLASGSISTSGLNSSQKNARPQSPIVSSSSSSVTNQSASIKIENNQQTFSTNSQQISQSLSAGSAAQRVGTPTISERNTNNQNQQNITNTTSSSSSNQGVVGGGGSSERTTSKRSRRPRNENINNMDLGGNESNSANESGNLHQLKNNQLSNVAGGSGGGGTGGGGSGGGGGSSSAGQKKSGNNQSSGSGAGGKKKKRKTRGQGANQNNARDTRDDTPPPDPIDPDEPTYCLCDQISFGEMILCDNDLCPIEWFHFSCVALMSKPKGKWFCPNCRGDRPNVMKPKAQFLKELERYNKEKEA